ncbi:bifunctional adenosylcobinamide kinase/adenosylcobinamide-phosphate guanylyltransferase [Nocardioides euryhalodurans]|uniref:bifunctional adenosylcobinamide kinase/adenosylcobinamide-phosphate guanylyltransferase n=1 Tax=Nocardioides euryhalodurans TaxID=2518370 RepID=UPI001FC911BD|nr:bifunctional adenosylcobinamide kinase/adenosylcobinamide-phosphate guanylyltransferase [Nocardioides euryhalodurans]
MDPLHDHGDRQVPAGTLDLAVNVLGPAPDWLLADLREVDLTGYPDPAPAVAALADRHRTAPARCLPLHGAAEAFWLVAQAIRPRLAACVHPSFTAPEAALRSAGVPVQRVLRDPAHDFALDSAAVPEEADLVVLGRPDNPTGRLDTVEAVAALARPGRVLVVDEAFADFLPEADGLHGSGIPGLLCVRSLTKLWGLAGLRVGYLLGPEALVARLAAVRQPWPVGSTALRAAEVLAGAEEERRLRAQQAADDRAALLEALAPFPLTVWPSPANFLLLRSDRADLRERLLDHGLAVRRGRTFPGLDDHHVRVSVHPDPAVRAALVDALGRVLPEGSADQRTTVADRPAGHRTLVLGGARSGKSRHAQQLLAGRRDVLYVAPGPVPDGSDADWAARVAAHREDRPATWTTVETTDVAGALESADRPVLVDCLATWLAAAMSDAGAWESADGDSTWQRTLDDQVERLLRAWRTVPVPVVAVSNEVGSGVVPGTRSGVLFRDALGRLNRRLADASEDVRLVVAGRVQQLDGDLG